MALRKVYHLGSDTLASFSDNGGSLLGAALAFYTVLSVAPMMLIILSLVGWVLGEEAAAQALSHPSADWIDPRAIAWTEDLVAHLQNSEGGRSATLAGSLFLLWSGTRLFAQLQGALNQLWRIRPPVSTFKVSLLSHIYRQLLASAAVLVLGGLFIAAIVLSSAATLIKSTLGTQLPGSEGLWAICTVAATVCLMTSLFTFIYRCLPDDTVRLGDAFVGGTVTALLFTVVEYPLTVYLARQGVDTAYGAAASLVAFLVWVYYSAQIFFVGAQFTVVYAAAHGRGLEGGSEAMARKEALPVSAAPQGPSAAPDPAHEGEAVWERQQEGRTLVRMSAMPAIDDDRPYH